MPRTVDDLLKAGVSFGGGTFAAPDQPKDRNLAAVANDTVIEAANAVAGWGKAAGDFIAPGNFVSQGIGRFIEEGEASQSDVAQAAKQTLRSDIEQADGIGGELAAVGRYVVRNPLLTAAQAVGSFVGPGAAIKGAQLAARGLGFGAKGVTRAGVAGGVAAGAAGGGGDAAGNAYELVMQTPLETLMQHPQAQALAEQGADEAQIRDVLGTAAARQATGIPAVIGGLSGAFGAERLLAGGARMAGWKGGAKLTAFEAGQEFTEEGATQFEAQRAAAAFNPEIEPTKGVAAAAGMGAVMGGVMGGGVQAITGDNIRATQTVPEVGVLSAAANAGTEARAQALDAAPPVGPRKVEPPPVDPVFDRIRTLPEPIREEAMHAYAIINREGVAKGVQQYNKKLLDKHLSTLDEAAAKKAGKEWQAIAPAQPADDLAAQQEATRTQLEAEQAGARAGRATDQRIEAVGQQWQDLGITDPATDLQRQKSGMADDILTPSGSPFKSKVAAGRALKTAGEGYSVAEVPGGFVVRKDWREFLQETGTKAIPRAEMPQVEGQHHGALTNFLNARGVTHETVEVDPASLKPTQAEYSEAKVEQQAESDSQRGILISSDGHVIDGHHKWLAAGSEGQPVKAIRLNAPVADLLPLIKEFPSAKTADDQAAAAEQAAPEAAGDLPAVRAGEQPAAVAGGGDGQAGADAAADAEPALREPAPVVSSSTSTPVPRAAEPAPAAINSGEKADSGSTPESATSGTAAPSLSDSPEKWATKTTEYTKSIAPSAERVGQVADYELVRDTRADWNQGDDGRFLAVDKKGNVVADVFFGRRDDGKLEAAVEVAPAARRQGIASAIYEQIERSRGERLAPAAQQTADARAFWVARQRRASTAPSAAPGKPTAAAKPEAKDKAAPEPDKAPAAQKPFDPGELSIPNRTSTIDADLDRYKAEQAKAQRTEQKGNAIKRRADKARAKELFEQLWPAMKDRMGARFGEKELRSTLDSMVKWEPAKFVALAEKFQGESRESGPDQDAQFKREDQQEDQSLSEVEKILDKDTPPTKDDIAAIMRILDARRGGLSVEKAQEIVDSLTAKWKNGPVVRVVASARDLPIKAPSNVRGIYRPGEVWVVAGSHRDGKDVRRTVGRTLAHEAIAHYGLRDMLDADGWGDLMGKINGAIAAGNKPLTAIQAEVRRLYVDDKGKFNLRPEIEADEIAARVVEAAVDENGEFRPGFGFVKAVYAKIAEFLRSLGIDVTFTNAELQGMLVLAQRNLEVGKRTAGGGEVLVAAARDAEPDQALFSRSAITGQALPKTWQAPDETKLDDFIYTIQDKHIDTKRAVQAVRDSIGQIADAQDPYLQEELFHGRAAMATKEFLEKQLRPLLVDMQARGVEMSDFEEYLHNRHAERRNVQVAKVNPNMPDGGSGIKTADAAAYLAGLPAAKRQAFEALAKRVEAINRETRALLVSSGLEKQKTIDAWEAAYGDEYVPLMREEMDNGAMGIGQGYSVRGSASKRAMGSNKPVANIIANIALQRERTITRAEKKRIGEALYGLALKAPNDEFWFAIDPDLSPSNVMATQMQLIAMGLDPADAESIAQEPKSRYVDKTTGLVTERINPALRNAENVLAVRIDGEDKFVFFNKDDPRAMRMVTALKNLDADQLGTVMGTVARMTRWFASVNTQYNPVFGVTNITRDVQTALLNLNSTPLKNHKTDVLKHTLSALRGIYIDLRDHRAGKQPTSAWASLFEEFQREGGATGYRDMFANAEERAEKIAAELKAVKDGTAMKLGKGVMGWLSDYNETMENSVRLAAYKVGKEQGLSNQQAASLAKNLTVNFNRKGQTALQVGALYAFFNAAVQGTARMGQTLFEGGKLSATGKKILTGGILLGSMQALLLAAAGFDDDEPPDFVRERALVIPIGGSKYVAIPMPLGFHVIPNLGRIPTEWAMGGFKNTTKYISQLVGIASDAFNPIGSAGVSLQTIAPTIIDPLAALSENRDWTGKPIARKDFNTLAPTAGHTRAKDTATPWAKAMSYGINIATGGTDYKPGLASPTPDQIDYLIGQITGGVGREIGKIAQVAGGTMSGEDVPMYKIPLVGRFVGTTEGQAAEASRFYDNLRRLGEHKVEIEGLRKDRRSAELLAYIRENKEARLVQSADRLQREVSKLQKAKRALIAKGASAQEVKFLDARITTMMKRLNDQVRAIES